MKKADIPQYHDPDSFTDGNATYPCDTQFMVYNPMLHRYFLTGEALDNYGLNAERLYISNSQNKIQELIDKTSKKVYDYIQYKAGFNRYHVMMYRIATAPKTIYPDQYFMRKQFEEALIDQARFIIMNSDSAEVGRFSIDNDLQQPPPRPEDNIKDFSDISAECARTLDTLNLTRWFALSQFVKLDESKY